MQGSATQQMAMLSLASPDQRIPHDHPIRTIKALADRELTRLSPVFDQMAATTGRPSIPPEAVLKSLLLIALYSIRSERQLAAHTTRRGGSAIDSRTTRHATYNLSQRIRKRVKEIVGWMKTVGGFRTTRFEGGDREQLAARWVGAAQNLLRMANLSAHMAGG